MARLRFAEDPYSRLAIWSRRMALFSLAAVLLSIIIVRSGLVEVEPGLATFGGALVFAGLAILTGLASFVVIWRDGLRGLGFAVSLGPMDLPPAALALALLAFNLGIEAVQVAIVVLALPLAVLARGVPAYGAGGMRIASALAACIAAIWFADRVFGLGLPLL